MKNTLLLLALTALLFSCQSETPADNGSTTDDTPTLQTKIGQMLLFGFRGMSADESSSIIQDIQAGRIGSVILFDYDVKNKEYKRNIESPEQVKALIDSLQAHTKTPLIVSIDQV